MDVCSIYSLEIDSPFVFFFYQRYFCFSERSRNDAFSGRQSVCCAPVWEGSVKGERVGSRLYVIT